MEPEPAPSVLALRRAEDMYALRAKRKPTAIAKEAIARDPGDHAAWSVLARALLSDGKSGPVLAGGPPGDCAGAGSR